MSTPLITLACAATSCLSSVKDLFIKKGEQCYISKPNYVKGMLRFCKYI